jgi:hypothetical protein
MYLSVTAFDSGPLRLSEEEILAGWKKDGEVAVSPPLRDSLVLPQGEYDEWYIHSAPFAVADVEVFVNYGGFTLEPQADDWLKAAQASFWTQLHRLRPMSYIAMGDNDVVVSRNRDFVEAVRGLAGPTE